MAVTLNPSLSLSNFQQAEPGAGDYLQSVDPSKLMEDPRFLRDLREYYAMNGERGLSDDDLIRKWYDDRTFAELNVTLGTTGDVLDTYNSNAKERELKARLVDAYHKTPFFWQKGGMGERDGWQVARSIGWALATDPLSYVGPIKAYGVAGQAVRSAAQRGAQNLTTQGAKAGALAGMKAEAAYAAPITAGADLATQYRDQQLGLQGDIDLGRAGMAGVGGALLGGGVGAVMGGATGAMTGRANAFRLQKDALNRTYEQRPGDFPRPRLGDDLVKNEKLISLEEAETARILREDAQAEPEAAEPTEAEIAAAARGVVTKPSDINTEATQMNLNDALAALQEAHRDGVDQSIIDELQIEVDNATISHSLAQRIEAEAPSIAEMAASPDASVRARAKAQQAALNADIGIYRRIQEGQPLTQPDDIARAKEILGSKGGQGTTMPDPTLAATQEMPSPAEPARPAEAGTPTEGADAAPVPARGEGEAVVDGAPAADGERVSLDSIEIVRAVPDKDGNLEPVAFNAGKLYSDITNRIDRLHELRLCLSGA